MEQKQWIGRKCLSEMYQRFSEAHGFTFEIDDYEPGDEAGVKSVSVLIKGKCLWIAKGRNGRSPLS